MDVQSLVAELLRALDVSMSCGSVTLNMNDSRLQSVRTETYTRIVNPLDRRPAPRQT